MAGNAEYAIDIAAELTGDETLAELDELTSELMGAGRGAEFFQTAIQRVSRDLADAASAASAANAALSDGQAEYRALEAAANQAAKTVERLGLKGDTMSRAYLEAARASDEASAALALQAEKLSGLEKAATAANAREKKLADTMRGVKTLSGHVDKTLAGQAESFEKLGSSLGAFGGPLGRLGQATIMSVQGFAKLSASIGTANAAAVAGVVGIGALAAAAVALTAAVTIGVVKLAEYAIKLGDTARNAGLAREAFEAMNPGVAALRSNIDALSTETQLGVPTLNNLAKGLLDAGESAENMSWSLRTAALAEKALGATASAEYIKLVSAASDAQKAVDEAARKSGGAVSKELTEKLNASIDAVDTFAYRAETKLGGVVARQLQGVGAQSQRLESNMSKIFGGLDIDPALAGLAKLVGIFDENSASGRAIKFLFETIFQPLIDGADEAATAVEAFVLGFLIGAMKIYLALRPAIRAVAEFFGLDGSDLEIDFKTITDVAEELAPVLLAVAAIVGGALLLALGAVAVAIGIQVAIWYSLYKAVELVIDVMLASVAAIWGIATAVYDAFVGIIQPVIDFFQGEIDLSTAATRIVMGFINGVVGYRNAVVGAFTGIWSAVWDWFKTLPYAQLGIDLINGFISGITGRAGAVVSAVSGVMKSALASAKSVLGIASPSKEMQAVAGFTVDGYTNEVEASTPDVQSAMSEMLAVPPANDATPALTELEQAQLSGDVMTIERLQGVTSPGDSAPPRQPPSDDTKRGGAGVAFGAGTTFNFYGLPDAKSAMATFEEMLDAAIDGDAAKLGAAAARGRAA